MRILPLGKVKPGFIVAKDIYNPQGNILIAEGQELTANNLKRLKQLGINRVYIKIEGEPSVKVPEVISQKKRNELVQNIKQHSKKTIRENDLDANGIEDVAEEIIMDILDLDEVIFHLQDIRNHDNYIFDHMVSVCILSITIATDFVYTKKELKQIAAGALLHDIGLLMLDETINKGSSAQDHQKYKTHTLYGYNILRETTGISLLSAHIAYQHHEKIDGTGFPRNLVGDEIHEFAQIVAVANIYDKLNSPTPDKAGEKLSPHKALKFIDQLKGNKLKGKYVEALKKHIASYPIGTQVLLNNGQYAIVTDVNSNDLEAPIVKILQEQSNGKIEEVTEKNLMHSNDLWIEKIIE